MQKLCIIWSLRENHYVQFAALRTCSVGTARSELQPFELDSSRKYGDSACSPRTPGHPAVHSQITELSDMLLTGRDAANHGVCRARRVTNLSKEVSKED